MATKKQTLSRKEVSERARKVMALAMQLMRHNTSLTQSAAMRLAYATVAARPELQTLIFWKVDRKTGHKTRQVRVVDRNFKEYFAPRPEGEERKPSGRKRPEGIRYFGDIARKVAGLESAIMSTYKDRIIAIY